MYMCINKKERESERVSTRNTGERETDNEYYEYTHLLYQIDQVCKVLHQSWQSQHNYQTPVHVEKQITINIMDKSLVSELCALYSIQRY